MNYIYIQQRDSSLEKKCWLCGFTEIHANHFAGGANIRVGELVNNHIPGSWLRGSSTSNNRIERFWEELKSKCFSKMKLLFHEMETVYRILNPDYPVHKLALFI